MPITQDRIQALISAARDYQKAFESCLGTIRDAWGNVTEYGMDPREQLERVHNLTIPNAMILERSDSAAVIMVEEKWFKRFGKVNERNRRAQARRRQRRGEGLPAAQGTPQDTDYEVRNLQHLLKIGMITQEKYNSLVVNGRYVGWTESSATGITPPAISAEQAAEDRAKQISADEDAEDERRRAAMREEYERMKAAKEADGADEGSAGCDKSSQGDAG